MEKVDDFPLECGMDIDLVTKRIDFKHTVKAHGKYDAVNKLVMPMIRQFMYIVFLVILPVLIFAPFYFSWLLIQGTINYDEFVIITLGFGLLVFFLIYGLPFFSYPLSRFKWFQKLIPQLGKLVHEASNGVSQEMVITETNGRRFEIPLFSNAYLDYECHGEFSDFLERIKIEPSRFHSYLRKQDNVYKGRCKYWKAIFFFKKKPRNGCMMIKFI